MCNKAVEKNPVMIRHVPTCFITQRMFENVILIEVGLLNFIPKQFKTQHMCNFAIGKVLCRKWSVPNPFKTQ